MGRKLRLVRIFLMNKYGYFLRLTSALVVGVLSALAFVSAFYPIRLLDVQFVALLQRSLVDFSVFAILLFMGLVLLTVLFGRIYCSTLCPLGIYQELLMLVFHRKNSLKKNRPYKYFLAAIVLGTLVGGTAFLVRFIDPYTLFGSVASGAVFGGVMLALLAVLVWFKGRWFCSNICPVGAVLGLISKFSLNKIYMESDKCISCGKCASKCPTGSIDFKSKSVDNETCVKCLNCLRGCPKDAIHFGVKPQPSVAFSPMRRKLLVGGAVVAVFALAVKGGISLGKAVAAKVKKVILPAGGESAEDFANRCLNCNLCVQNCPMKIIKKANADYPAVHLDYSDSFCDYNCHRCSEVCPSGAIKKISLAEKQRTQIGLAHIDEDYCVKCGLCVRKCPRQAITKEKGAFPIVHADICIGCGACQVACSVEAIKIMAVDRQQILK